MNGFRLFLTQSGLSATTIHGTVRRLEWFFREYKQVNENTASQYILDAKARGRANNGINFNLKALKWWGKYQDIEALKSLKLLPDSATNKEILSDGEVAEFLALECPKTHDLNRWHTYEVFWNVVAKTGMRVGSVARLQVGDVNFGTNTFHVVRDKTGPHNVPIPESLVEILKDYVKTRDLWLFPSKCKNVFGEPVLPNQAINYDFHMRRKMLGIKRKISPHSFRHSFAVRLKNGGAEMAIIQRALAHKSIATTIETYAHVGIEDVRREIMRCDAMERAKADPKYAFEYIKNAINVLGLQDDKRLHFEFTYSEENIHLQVSLKKEYA